MPSIIPGFEYDIFISYRQKDNKHDGWVTTFVGHLKNELEMTSKDELSVYFDENADDGLLENHEVTDTLNAKLKCLIFIPIISQTYCDPNSYAWKNEFLPFKKLASEDQHGLKIRLHNGNIASRILPIRIHELDVHDTLLLERELNGPLRPIDFIFKAPGVNRPLMDSEDHPQQNQFRIYYRDQINKVANQIKGIVKGIKSPRVDISKPSETKPAHERRARWKKSLMIILTLAVIFTIGVLIINKAYQKSDTSVTGRIPVAILPFKVNGADRDIEYFADGIQEAIRINLSRFPELKVKSRTSVERFRNFNKSARDIADELGVAYILEGTTQKVGDNIRVMVELFDDKADVVWSDSFDRNFRDVFEIQNQISELIAKSLKAKLTPKIEEQLNKTPTKSFEAYDLYLKARQASRQFEETGDMTFLDKSIELLNQAIQIDPDFANCYGWLSGLALIKNMNNLSDFQDSIITLANKALALDSAVVEADITLSHLYYASNDDVNALRYTYKALENESMDSISSMQFIGRLSSIYLRIGDSDQALYILNELQKLSLLNEEVLYKKILILAADNKIDNLIELRKTLSAQAPDSPLIQLINFHVALANLDIDSLIASYDKIHDGKIPVDWFDQYSAIIAYCLKQRNRSDEAQKLIERLNDLLGDEPYYQAQIELFNNNENKALQLLLNESVGWYNLNLSLSNPLMKKIENAEPYKKFIERNRDRALNLQERVHQLELRGYLHKPFLFLETYLGTVETSF